MAVLGFALASPCAAADAQAGATRPRVGLVLSGGGARGVAHLGVLRVLEQLRIPIDCIAGASMGALVGGVYASGMSLDEIEAQLRDLDWDALFDDDPERAAKPFSVKKDDFENYFHFELGFRKRQVLLPTGTTAGYKFEFFIRELTERAGNFPDRDFDSLPIPYRAVATNLENGTLSTFRRGDLAKVMRASMSVPGVIAPIELNGALHVDGGLVRNLPVDIAREACADVVIAVNLGTPLLPKAELGSVVGVALQSINLLTEQNVRASLASLGPRDILIEPALSGYSSSDFSRAMETIAIGAAAANEKLEALKRLGVSAEAYAAWRAHVIARLPAVPPVTDVQVKTTQRVSGEVIERELAEVPGIDLRRRPETDFSLPNLHKRLTEVYGRGDFERMDYQMVDRPGARIVLVEGVEKAWGPDYLKFGLGVATDNDQARFSALARYRKTWLNSFGAEWRNDLQMGTYTRVASEFYQPLGLRAGAFVAPRFDYTSDPVIFFSEGRRLGEYKVSRTRIHIDGGVQNYLGEARAGVFAGRLKANEDFGLVTTVPDYDIRQAGYTFSATFDRLDNVNFPRNGFLARLTGFGTVAGWGSDDNYTKLDLKVTGAKSMGRHTLSLLAEAGVNPTGTVPPYDPFQLGGFQRLSGYRMDQLNASEIAFGRAVYYYQFARLPSVLGRGIYAGGSLEGGKVNSPLDPSIGSKWRPALGLFIGADTVLGPVYLGWGKSLIDDSRSFYFLIGRP